MIAFRKPIALWNPTKLSYSYKEFDMMQSRQPTDTPKLGDEAQRAEADVEYKQRVDGDADAVPHDARAAEDADAGRHRPGHECDVDGDPRDHVQPDGTEQRRDDEREERVADDADGLEERSRGNICQSPDESEKCECVHVPAEKLDLQRDHRGSDPDEREHAREDGGALVLFRAPR